MTEGQFVVLSRRAPKKGFLGKLLVDDEPADQRGAGDRWLQWTLSLNLGQVATDPMR